MSCTAATLECKPSPGAPLPECCRRNILEMVYDLGIVFKLKNVTWWMDYGTLLGAVRNKSIIPHDRDADFGFLAEDWPRVRAAVELMKKNGWIVIVQPQNPIDALYAGGNRVIIRVSAMNRTSIDLFPWYLDNETRMRYRTHYLNVDKDKGREFPENKLLPLRYLPFEGMMLPAPAHPEWLCEHRYGPDWETPDV